jgi:CheY-like chemotaxis protein
MSSITGHEVATRQKEMPETRQALVIAVTANALQTDHEIALVAGCDGYLTKPIDVDALPGSRFHVVLPMNASVLRTAAHAGKQ